MTGKYYDALDNVLDRPIAFNPSFKKITGSTNAALLLSQAFYWTKRTKDIEGWFYKTRDEWMEETGLTEAELDGAREKCRLAGVIEEKLKGVPATIHYRVVKAKVYLLLGVQFPEIPESSFPRNSQIPEKPESGIYGNFNRNTENTAENKEIPQNMPVEWYIQHDLPIPEHLTETKLAEKEALDNFEQVLGFGELPWDSTKDWKKLRDFVVSKYHSNDNVWRDYQAWRIGKGKYDAMSNKQIRLKPDVFMDTGFPSFVAHSAMNPEVDKPLRML